MTTTETTTRNITGVLSPKRVGAYMKQSHKTGNTIRVQRCSDDIYLVADGFTCVRLESSHDLFPYTYFNPDWERASFIQGSMVPTEGGADIQSLWNGWTSDEMYPLTLTHYLYEIAGSRNKPGHLYRQFTHPEAPSSEEVTRFRGRPFLNETYIDKRMCDMLSPDLDEIEGFLFETTGREKPVCVAARYGYVAVMMPLFKTH